jgi:hypothetical protein
MGNDQMDIHSEPRSSVKELLKDCCPVVFITHFEVFVESYPGGINGARLADIPGPRLISGHKAAKNLQIVVLSRRGGKKYKLRTDNQFLSEGREAMPVIGQTKETNVWFPASDRDVIRPLPAIPNVASRNGAAECQIIQFVKSVPGISARMKSMAGLLTEVMDARRIVSPAGFGFFLQQ